jgi:hypothetical protein
LRKKKLRVDDINATREGAGFRGKKVKKIEMTFRKSEKYGDRVYLL